MLRRRAGFELVSANEVIPQLTFSLKMATPGPSVRSVLWDFLEVKMR